MIYLENKIYMLFLPQQEVRYKFIHVYEVYKLKISMCMFVGGEWSESVSFFESEV